MIKLTTIKKALLTGIVAASMIATSLTAYAATDASKTIAIDVNQTFTVKNGSPDTTVTYNLTPDTESHQEGYTSDTAQAIKDGKISFQIGDNTVNDGDFSIKGTDKTAIKFTFKTPGLYVFTLSMTTEDKTNYTYDHSTYRIRVYARNDNKSFITVAPLVDGEEGNKVDGIDYSHSYAEPETPNTPKEEGGEGYGSVIVYKVDAEDDNIRLAGVTFEVTKTNGEYVTTITTDDKGMASIPSLPVGTYRLKEMNTPDGYHAENRYIYFTVIKDTTIYSPTNVKVTNTKAEKVLHIVAIKNWDDNNYSGRPTSVTLALTKNGNVTDNTQVVSAENNWTVDFGLLPDDGSVYDVVEIDVPSNYTSSSTKEVNGTDMIVTVTNTYHQPIDTSRTGDDSNMMLYAGVMGAAVICLAGWFVMSRKAN